MKNQFEDKLKSDFTSAVPDVLDKIKQDNRFKIPEPQKKRSLSDVFKLRRVRYTFATLFLVVLVAIVVVNRPAEQIYASTVTLDINPQVEITLDEDDKVINIIALNDDGTEIINDLGDFKRHGLQEIIPKLVQHLYQRGYLDNTENVMMIYVDGVSEQVQLRVQEFVENKLQEEASKFQKTFQFVKRNNLDYTPEQLNRINSISQENNIHPGRVILILEILDADDTYTRQELANMSMRQLYAIYQSLFPNQSDDSGNNGNSNGSGHGN